MEGEVCMFNKFGFCKFQSECKREHYSEVCDQLSRCSNIKRCNKRHPKNCKRYVSGNGCRFQEECAYYHHGEKQEELNELKRKVDILEKKVAESTNKEESEKLEQFEKVVKALTRKVLSLEKKITETKNKMKPSGKLVEQTLSISEEEKESEIEKVLSENCLNDNISFNTSDIKDYTSTPKVNKVKVKKGK